MSRTLYRIYLAFIITSHHIGIWIITASVPLLFINEPIWVALPLSAWIMHLALNKLDCPYTRLENYLRRKLGLQEITTFISHYYKKPYHKLMWELRRDHYYHD
jgi:hypothetical protein